MPITSASNPRLKRLRAALRDGSPDLLGRVRIEGPKLIREAIRSRLVIEEVFVSEGRRLDREVLALLRQIPGQPQIVEVAERLFPGIAGTENPQGLLALAALPVVPVETLLQRASMVLVGCELQDPGNLGTLVRSAEAFGAQGVLLTRTSVNPWNEKAVRASAGSVFRVPCLSGFESTSLLRLLGQNGFRIVAATPRATTDFREADYRDRFALVLGNEGKGLNKEVLRFVQTQIHIPMADGIESLNVSVAASIVLCEAAHQRRKDREQ
ncbi:MAG: RNA methyltransferase [Acidimicrobiia bacterium]|nr:RNA methyltransferase [Acidimicrobiia bacterium]